jgi:hypothetical protein
MKNKMSILALLDRIGLSRINHQSRTSSKLFTPSIHHRDRSSQLTTSNNDPSCCALHNHYHHH